MHPLRTHADARAAQGRADCLHANTTAGRLGRACGKMAVHTRKAAI